MRSAESIAEAVSISRRTVAAFAALLIAFIAAPFLFGPYMAGEMVVMAIFAIGYNFLLGYGGEMSFGHAAYFALGAYGVILALTFLTSSIFVGILFALALTLLGALVIGKLSLVRRGVYFAMITLAFGQLVYYVIFRWSGVTGGSDGVAFPVVDFTLGPIDPFDAGIGFYTISVLVLLLVWFSVKRILNSPYGTALVAIRENETRAKHLGYNTNRMLVMSFAISGFYSGLAGVLYAMLFRYISPNIAFWTMSGEIVVITIIGGVGTMLGPIIGAGIFVVLSSWFVDITPHWPLLLGGLFIVVVLFAPQGIYGIYDRYVRGRASAINPLERLR